MTQRAKQELSKAVLMPVQDWMWAVKAVSDCHVLTAHRRRNALRLLSWFPALPWETQPWVDLPEMTLTDRENMGSQSSWAPSRSKSITSPMGACLSLSIVHVLFPQWDFSVFSALFLQCCATNFLCASASALLWALLLCSAADGTRLLAGPWAEPAFHISLPDGVWLWQTHNLHPVSCKNPGCQMGSWQPHAEPWQTVQWTRDRILIQGRRWQLAFSSLFQWYFLKGA